MRTLRALQPTLAALLAACVLLLGLAASSPTLHEELCAQVHAHDHAHDHHDSPGAPALADADHICAVTLFAGGCTIAPASIPLSPPAALNTARVAAFTEFLLARTLRGPARVCGPPALA
jgi:hypothetical protein